MGEAGTVATSPLLAPAARALIPIGRGRGGRRVVLAGRRSTSRGGMEEAEPIDRGAESESMYPLTLP